MKSVHFLAASQGSLLNWLSPMHELSPPPGRTTHTPARRARALAWLIILSYAAKVESAAIAKRDVTLVMSSGKKKKKNPGGRGGKRRAKK